MASGPGAKAPFEVDAVYAWRLPHVPRRWTMRQATYLPLQALLVWADSGYGFGCRQAGEAGPQQRAAVPVDDHHVEGGGHGRHDNPFGSSGPIPATAPPSRCGSPAR
jgi:hypothetical protein